MRVSLFRPDFSPHFVQRLFFFFPPSSLNSLVQTLQDEEEAGLLELLKSQICDNAALYAQKYDEEFQPYLPQFVKAIWNLLVSTGQEVKYDLVRESVPSCFQSF